MRYIKFHRHRQEYHSHLEMTVNTGNMATKLVLSLAVLALIAIQSGLAGHTHSFAHFHGPVKGPEHEVVIHDKHGHHHIDYVAHPKYDFAYGIEDHHTGNYYGQKEHRDGKKVIGEYTVKEPDGNTRTVTYHADPHEGFFAHVHNSAGNNHHGGTYGGHGYGHH